MKEEPISRKISIKEKMRIFSMMTKLGIKVGQDQIDSAIDSIHPLWKISELSKEANKCVYKSDGTLQEKPDYINALVKIDEALDLCHKQIAGFKLLGQVDVYTKIEKDMLTRLNNQKDIISDYYKSGAHD